MMKTFLLTATAVLALTAGSAFAVDLGTSNLQFSNDLVIEYDTKAELWATTNTPELRYIPLEGLSMYVSTDVDLQDIDFAGATVGIEYYPNIAKLDLMTYVKSTSDADFNFDGAIVGAELKF
jgi:hypothetical protein